MLIIPVDNHYIGRVTWRGQATMKMIKDKFEELKLLDRAKKFLFKNFFETTSLQFSCIIIHQIFRRIIKPVGKNELQFEVGGKYLKFGIGEFALITGLNFGAYLDKEVPHSTRLVCTWDEPILGRVSPCQNYFSYDVCIL